MTSTLASLRTKVLALATAVLALGLPIVSAGGASAVTPATRDVGAVIDAYPSYESETGCLEGVRPGITAMRDKILMPTYGGTSWDYLTQRTCSPTKASGHDNGTALDWMMNIKDPVEYANATSFLDWLLATDKYGNAHANLRRLGIMYVVYNNKIFRGYRASAGWTDYHVTVNGVKTPCSQLTATSYNTTCHRDHVHMSWSQDGAYQRTTHWTAPTVEPVLALTAPIALTTTSGSTVTVKGTTAKSGDVVQVYIRRSGETNWIAILSPFASDSANNFSTSYTTSRTHDVQVRVGTTVSNIGRVTVQ